MNSLSNKKLYILRYLSYWLYVLCTIGIPVGLISWQYEIFKQPSGTQLTAYGIILIIVVLFICRGHIKRAIIEMETCITKTILLDTGRLLPWVASWFIIAFLSEAAAKVQFILFWAIIGNFIAIFIDIWHTALLKECARRNK